MRKIKHWLRSISDLTKALVCISIFFVGITWYAYDSPSVRLDHFASLATVLGSLATATTLIWLVIERNQLQKEKWEDEKRKQANGVSAWLSKKVFHSGHLTKPIIILNNNSDSPIYNVVISIVDAQNKNSMGEETSEELRQTIDASPLGQRYCFAPKGYNGMNFHPGIEIAFSDANGVHWVRRGNGRLEILTDNPFAHYKVPQPVTYESLQEF